MTTACSNGSTEAPGFALRDSSGVQIVTSSRPAWGNRSAWRIGAGPSVSIGGVSSSDGHLVWQVRSAARLSDGRLAILVGGTTAPRVLIADRSGVVVRSIGRAGRGPGEFSEPEALQYLSGDTLVVWERFFGAISSFDTTGALVRHRELDYARVYNALNFGGERHLALPLADGSFIARAGIFRDPRNARPVGKWYRPQLAYVRIRPDYTADTLGIYEGPSLAYASAEARFPTFPLIGTNSAVAAQGNDRSPDVYASNGDRNVVNVYDTAGRLTRLFALDVPPMPITRADRKAALHRVAQFNNMSAERMARRKDGLGRLPEQTHHPPMRFLLVDRLGYLWALQKIDPSWATIWYVLDPRGRWLGVVRIPLFHIYDIGADFIIGLRLDESMVESVHEYSLDRQR